MNRLAEFARLGWSAFFLLVVWLSPLVALAQEAEEEEPKSYVLAYALMGFCVGLGIFVVVRPGKRRFPKIKPKTDDDDEVKPKGH